MYSFIFVFPPEHYKPGYVERIMIEGPFYRMAQNPQTGQPGIVRGPNNLPIPDKQAAGRYAASLAFNENTGSGFLYPYKSSTGFVYGFSLQPDGMAPAVEGPPRVIMFQLTGSNVPSVSGQQVMAAQPYGPPVGNGGSGAPPSVPVRQPADYRARDPLQATTYEPLDDSALPVTPDGFMDADPQGGTFMDIDTLGEERRRSLEPRPYDPSKLPQS